MSDSVPGIVRLRKYKRVESSPGRHITPSPSGFCRQLYRADQCKIHPCITALAKSNKEKRRGAAAMIIHGISIIKNSSNWQLNSNHANDSVERAFNQLALSMLSFRLVPMMSSALIILFSSAGLPEIKEIKMYAKKAK